ncbi:MAG TPA: hypothetical protein VMP10_05195 [Chloroflexota bacterium]|nr:hypothetical protein [Chloroflexota bacterium]
MTDQRGQDTTDTQRLDETLAQLQHRRHQLRDWLQIEETSREGAHERKAEVLRGRLEEIEWAISLLRP